MPTEKHSQPIDSTHEQDHEEPFEYELLTGHRRTDGSYKDDMELRMQYIQLTDTLIYKMTDGMEVLDPKTGEKEKHIPDVVIFLDKSARPLAWLVKELWNKLAPDADSEDIPEMPDFKFLNIDREQWVNTVDPDGKGYVDINKVDPSLIRSLRSIFVGPQYKQEGLSEDIDTAPSSLDGKKIMVVDEVYSTGRTLKIATEFVRRAFPTSIVGGTHWMGGTASKGLATGNADLPVWYKDNDVTGRGVGNRYSGSGEPSANVTQRLGTWFLSSRFPKPDPNSLQLRKELRHLAHDPTVPIRPSSERDDDDAFERLERLNGMPARDVLAAISRALGKPLGRQ